MSLSRNLRGPPGKPRVCASPLRPAAGARGHLCPIGMPVTQGGTARTGQRRAPLLRAAGTGNLCLFLRELGARSLQVHTAEPESTSACGRREASGSMCHSTQEEGRGAAVRRVKSYLHRHLTSSEHILRSLGMVGNCLQCSRKPAIHIKHFNRGIRHKMSNRNW